jgi:hypothetical protein
VQVRLAQRRWAPLQTDKRAAFRRALEPAVPK